MSESGGRTGTTLHHVKASTQFKREHKADYGREKIEVLYEDGDIIVINKPSGMLSCSYPGSRSRTAQDTIERMFRAKKTLSKTHRPLVVHRLDRDTSGVMMFALNEKTQKKVMDTWHQMVTERLYRAVAENPHNPKNTLPDSGLIDSPLAQNSHHFGYVKHDEEDSAPTVPARTHFKVIVRGTTHTLFELSLDTGKKNQIRAHLASKGYPLAGDENYRARTDPFHRLALHARTLEFFHPTTGKKMKFEAAEDAYWREYVEKGDRHPETPVWILEKEKPRRNSNGFNANEFSGNGRISRKAERKMDFIARGKARAFRK